MMRGRGAGDTGAAGGLAPHIPVLAPEALALLAPRKGGVYVDATFGAGGHTRAILQAADCRVIAIDRDPTAVARGLSLVAEMGGRLTIYEDRFSELESVLQSAGVAAVDGVLIDLGVSSMQLDEAERGFSFRNDGPLDMRMGSNGPSAADVVAVIEERDLATILARLGEERLARPVARAIVAERSRAPITTTRMLAAIVERVVRAKPGDIHPATRTFQALRMFVNEELEEAAAALSAAERVLAPGGRLAVISFHSLEDRLVKRFFAARSRLPAVSRHQPPAGDFAPSFIDLTPKVVVAGDAEVAANPRARSAKLRAGERTDAPPLAAGIEAIPGVPLLHDIMRGRR